MFKILMSIFVLAGGSASAQQQISADNLMENHKVYEIARDAAIAEIGTPPLLMPEPGDELVSVAVLGTGRYEVRFIASSPMDFARRVVAIVERNDQTGELAVVEMEISGRIDPFARP